MCGQEISRKAKVSPRELQSKVRHASLSMQALIDSVPIDMNRVNELDCEITYLKVECLIEKLKRNISS